MTQQQISKLLDVPDRTLRDWKNNRQRLYSLLETLDYNEAKEKLGVSDLDDIIEFEPKEYSYNTFWQTHETSKERIYIIYRYST